MDTLLLDREPWDLCLDVAGNIALATEPYSILQDVASRCRLFLGEAYYDTTQGLRYFEDVLGKFRPTQLLKQELTTAALSVPGVLSATVYLTNIGRDRTITGQVQVRTVAGVQVVTL